MRRARSVRHVRREGCEKNNACTSTVVHAIPAFIYERSYPIGYLMSHAHGMLHDNKIAVTSRCSVDKAIRGTLHLFPNLPDVKEKQKKCIDLSSVILAF